MIYFDTSYLVRLYFDELGSESVRKLASGDHLACAAHGHAEMIAAFHRKLRDRAIRPVAYAALLNQLREHDAAGAFQWLVQGPEVFARIARVYGSLP